MHRGSRWALCCLALLLSLFLLVKGRFPFRRGGDAAFSFARSPHAVVVRLAGDVPRPGVYSFPDGTSAESAIKMTVAGLSLTAGSDVVGRRRLVSGDVLNVSGKDRQRAVLSLERMPVKERMLLGIALDPDQLGADEWASLPGIGPVLAARITEERHINGAFGSLEGLARVPGVGPGKLKALRKYF